MFDLINSFRVVRSPLETAFFLQDLLTANEIRNLSIRLRIAKLLLAGKSQRDIVDDIHTSFATISKVSVWLETGGEGFKNVIKKLPLKWNVPKNLPKGPIEFHLPQTLLALSQYKVAKTQDKRMTKFIESVKNKQSLDRGLRKEFTEFYKELALEKRSLKAKQGFRKLVQKTSR